MTMKRKPDTTTIRIPIKYAEYAIVPHELFDAVKSNYASYLYECLGGEIIRIKFVAGCNNSDGRYSEKMNKRCMDMYNMPFSRIERVWYERLGRLSGFWHRVKMERVG